MANIDISKPEGLRDYSMARFNELAAAKYDAGQEEHKGLLIERVTFNELEEELIDSWHYLQAMKLRTIMLLEQREKEMARLAEMVESLKKDVLENEQPEESKIEAPEGAEGEGSAEAGEQPGPDDCDSDS